MPQEKFSDKERRTGYQDNEAPSPVRRRFAEQTKEEDKGGLWAKGGQEGWRLGFRFIFRHCYTDIGGGTHLLGHNTFNNPHLVLFPHDPSPEVSCRRRRIAKKQPHVRIYRGYCNIDESRVEFRVLSRFERVYRRTYTRTHSRTILHLLPGR